jgi:predicted permease
MQDLRLAVRALRATPVMTAVAILSLALGIGANTAIFSLVNSLLLRSLPVNDPARLALMTHGTAGALRGSQSWTLAIWNEVRERPHLFDSAFAWSWYRFNLRSGGRTEVASGLWASGGMFDTLGVPPLVGRTLTEADDQRGGGPDGPVVVISYAFWQRRFGGAADAVGRPLTLDGVTFTIVGVTPPDFFGPDVGLSFDLVVPFGTEPLLSRGNEQGDPRLRGGVAVMVRLKPGQSIDAASEALRGVQPQIREATLPARPQDRDRYLREAMFFSPAAGGQSSLRLRYQRPLLTIMVVVALVLLIACANLANLLLARATARRHEVSLRVALGASRWRLVRQLMAESVVLAAVGAGLGVLLASWTSGVLVAQLRTPGAVARTQELANQVFLDLAMDWRVLGFTITVTVGTVLLFGVAPALRASAVAPMEALKVRGAGASGEPRVGMTGGLVVAQVALSLVLVGAAGLFGRTFVSLVRLPLGFEPNRVLVVNVNAQGSTVELGQRLPVYEHMRDVVRALPGVAEAAVSIVTPVSGANVRNPAEVSGGVELPESERMSAMNFVSPGWFTTFGTPMLAGRDLDDRDRQGAPLVGIVNEAFARQFLHGASPLGHTLRIPLPGQAGPRGPIEIVGLVADAVFRSLREPVPPTMYFPLAQQVDQPFLFALAISVSIRSTGGNPALLTKSAAATMEGVNSQFALTFVPLTDQVNASLAQERLVAMLSGFFGGLALLLAGLGLYGVTAYAVTRRRTEIGIRMALGAAPAGVVRLVLTRVSSLVGVGVLVGAGISLWASQFVASLLYGLEPRDPATLVGAAVTLGAVSAMAGGLPAWRASRIDPAEVLRDS